MPIAVVVELEVARGIAGDKGDDRGLVRSIDLYVQRGIGRRSRAGPGHRIACDDHRDDDRGQQE